jgi:hypothetical protein
MTNANMASGQMRRQMARRSDTRSGREMAARTRQGGPTGQRPSIPDGALAVWNEWPEDFGNLVLSIIAPWPEGMGQMKQK